MWTLEGVDATWFNFTSDLIAVMTRVGLGMAIGWAHIVLLSWHLRAGHDMPMDQLGTVPGDFVQALQQAWKLREQTSKKAVMPSPPSSVSLEHGSKNTSTTSTSNGNSSDGGPSEDNNDTTAIPIQPQPKDVLFGVRDHPGNGYFRTLVGEYAGKYHAADRVDKAIIAAIVVSKIQDNGGRFLKKTNGWEAVDARTAREKVAHSFRNRRRNRRKDNNNNTSQQQQAKK